MTSLHLVARRIFVALCTVVALTAGLFVLPRALSIVGSIAPPSASLTDQRAARLIDPFAVVASTDNGTIGLCPGPGIAEPGSKPRCEVPEYELARIPAGTRLEATAARDRWLRYTKTRWLRVEYLGIEGWVSENDVKANG